MLSSFSSRALLLSLALGFSAMACGSEVSQEQQSSGTTGSGGPSSTSASSTGTGGAGGGASTTATTGAGGAAPAACGGKAGIPCGPDEWCQFDPPASCGNDDGLGICQPKPGACDADCPGVCGCDGKFYCNACGANVSGVDVSDDLSCNTSDSYRAVNMFTGAPRFAFLKASPVRNLCFRLVVESSSGGGIGIAGDGWVVGSAEVTHDVSDCDVGPGSLPPPSGASQPAASGEGTLSLAIAAGECTAGVHGKLLFSGGPAWVPSTEPVDVEGLKIEGGCP